MGTKFIPVALVALLLALQGQLWFGRGSVPNVSMLQSSLAEQKRNNQLASQANDRLFAEINDLKEGLEIVEERARAELGMVRSNEIYVQIAK